MGFWKKIKELSQAWDEKVKQFEANNKKKSDEIKARSVERRRQAAEVKKKSSPYEIYKETHPEITMIDQDGNQFVWKWKKPIVIYFMELLSIDEDNFANEKRQQVFVSRIKQSSDTALFITGFSFSSNKERSFVVESNGPGVPCIEREECGYDIDGFFYSIKEEYQNGS